MTIKKIFMMGGYKGAPLLIAAVPPFFIGRYTSSCIIPVGESYKYDPNDPDNLPVTPAIAEFGRYASYTDDVANLINGDNITEDSYSIFIKNKKERKERREKLKELENIDNDFKDFVVNSICASEMNNSYKTSGINLKNIETCSENSGKMNGVRPSNVETYREAFKIDKKHFERGNLK